MYISNNKKIHNINGTIFIFLLHYAYYLNKFEM